MKSLLTFVAGLAIGAGVTYVIQKNRYEEMIREEIEDLREHYKSKEGKPKNDDRQTEEQVDKMTSEEYDESIGRVHSLVRENRYTSGEDENLNNETKPPFVVTPDDFGTVPGFDCDTFYYHTDDIIANDSQEMMDEDDIQRTLGLPTPEIYEQFGIYEDDAVYIRNTALKCDYEVLRDEGIFIKRNGD